MDAALLEKRARQDALWADANIDGRVHWSIREAYHVHSKPLQTAIQHYYSTVTFATGLCQPQSSVSALTENVVEIIVAFAFMGCGPVAGQALQRALRPVARPGAAFRVTVRKRPLLRFELEAGVLDTLGVQPVHRLLLCHDGKLDRSGRRMSMTHREYALDWVWDETQGDADVHREVRPLTNWVLKGHSATLLCYGQTGTGKTYTMMGAFRRIAHDLQGRSLRVVFFEIHGKKCYDLLRDRALVHLRADAEENVHLRGARDVFLPDASVGDILRLLDEALALRAVEVTERNPISSRSHAVCDIRIVATADGEPTGHFRCVDLAGSERNYETVRMTAAQHRESADINFSLMALKDCFRAHAAGRRQASAAAAAAPQPPSLRPNGVPAPVAAKPARDKAPPHIPYRRSRLTQVLRKCFTDPAHRTVVIATVSPAATDLQHTINTANHVCLMAEDLERLAWATTCDVSLSSATFDVPVWKWTPEQVVAWVASAEGGRFAKLALPAGLDGRRLLELSAQRLGQLFEGTMRKARASHEGEAWAIGVAEEGESVTDALGQALFKAVRRENQRICNLERKARDRGTEEADSNWTWLDC